MVAPGLTVSIRRLGKRDSTMLEFSRAVTRHWMMGASRVFAGVVSAVLVFASIAPINAVAQVPTPGANGIPEGIELVATGLTNPRGFDLGPDGSLYVGLGGVGGDQEGLFAGVPSGIFGGTTASIIRINDGCATTVVDGIASGNWRAVGWIWGVMDVVFVGDQLYALFGGGGEDVGNPTLPNGVFRINSDGTSEIVANLSSWMGDVPPKFAAPDYGSDGSLFDMESDGESLWISEAVGGRLIKVGIADGAISLVADLSEGHLVPTGVALAPEGGAYVGFETTVPYPEGGSKVVHVADDGTVTDVWTGLTAVTDVAIGPDGAIYAFEMATNNLDEEPYLRPSSGRVVRQTGPDSSEVLITDLDYPVSLGFDDDGALYLGAPAFGANDGVGLGWIARVDLSAGTPISFAGFGTPASICATDAATPTA
jgi:hypothetical protein